MSENDNSHNVEFIDLATEMRQSFLEYAMSVIVSRALPDVKDGLKPVHRRIIYSMFDMKIDHNSSYKKSARIIGEVMGKYHPHGDSAIYYTMVRMAQDFSYRYPLVDGHGNFGSIDGDEPAAMRYTEARMSKIAGELVLDLEKNTVPWINNYDGSEQEPDYLTSYIPNLLINGSSGIAVGMTTSIPPFNLNEVIDCSIALLKDESLPDESLFQIIKGPDFPTGAIVSNQKKINEALTSGKGQITIRSKNHFENNGKRELLIFTEIPYQVNKSNILKKIAELVKENILVGIKDLRDESNRKGIRILIELKKDAQKNVLLNKLYKHTPLQTKFSINMLALQNKRPKLLNLKTIIKLFNKHRFDILIKKTKYELEKSEKKHNILLGLVIALNNINKVIEIIKKSRTTAEASENLTNAFNLNYEQSKAILEMRLQRLTGLEVEKIQKELKELEIKIRNLKELIANKDKQIIEIVKKLNEIKTKFGDDRRTEISDFSDVTLSDESLVLDKKTLIVLTKNNYIKRITFDEMRVQKRGGTGITCLNTSDDTINKIISCSTLDDILMFSNLGKVYRKKAYQIEKFSRLSHGIPIVNLLEIEKNEKIISIFKVDKTNEDENLVLVSKNGIIKKIKVFPLDKIRKTGRRVINFDADDSLANVELLNPNQNIILFTSKGKAVQFFEKELPVYSTSAKGVKGIKLNDSKIISLCVVDENEKLVLVSKNGIGKIINSKDIKHTHRGSSGVKSINIGEGDSLFRVKPLGKNKNVLLTSNKNNILIFKSEELPILSRTAKGVKLMNLKNGETSSLDLLTMEE